MPTVQRDFGGFDSKFLGVSVTIESERFFHILDELATTGEIDPGLASRSEPQQGFEAVSAASVVTHEARHFHDFLIAPAGAAILALRLLAYLNAIQFLSTMRDGKIWKTANCLPIPLPTWCMKAPEERDAFMGRVNAWRESSPPLVAPELPHIRPDDEPLGPTRTINDPYSVDTAAALVRATALQYERLGDLLVPPMTRGLDRPFLPMHISELSALLAQLQEVWEVLGEDAAALFIEHLADIPSMRYALPLQMFSAFLDLGQTDADVLSAMATWALFGPWPHGGDRESPVVRFSELALHLRENDWPDADEPVAELFTAWDAVLGRESTIDALQRSVELSETFLARLAARQSEAERGEIELFASPRRLFEMFLAARRHCVERFCASPDDYVRPHRYRNVGVGALTTPPVIYKFTGAFGPGGVKLGGDRTEDVSRRRDRRGCDGEDSSCAVDPPRHRTDR